MTCMLPIEAAYRAHVHGLEHKLSIFIYCPEEASTTPQSTRVTHLSVSAPEIGTLHTQASGTDNCYCIDCRKEL